jgi:hypothetical protein
MEYAKRDIEQLGEHYIRHVEAMTAEGLHEKSDIAAELAFRDAELAKGSGGFAKWWDSIEGGSYHTERDRAVAEKAWRAARNTSEAVRLTTRDWAEIYYALLSKQHSITADQDHEWREHLTEVMDKIGGDGIDAADDGVAPCR